MKKILIVLVLVMTINCYSQSIVNTTAGKSGILVGSEDSFLGISYENATDKFNFNSKFTKQIQGTNTDYPDFFGSNVNLGIKTEKNKSKLVGDSKWQGGIDLDYTFFRTWTSKKKTVTANTSQQDGTTITHSSTNYNQRTAYGRIFSAAERFYGYQLTEVNPDTTMVHVDNPLQATIGLTIGFYQTFHWNAKNDFSYGFSASLSRIFNSTRKLKESTLVPFNGKYLSDKDNTQVNDLGKQLTYYKGNPENEYFFVPRADIFYRFNLGDDRPVLGIVCSYSPLISSFKSVKVRNCFAIGPSVGLPSFTDHVVFALLNEFVQNTDGKFQYELTFNASIPLKFK